MSGDWFIGAIVFLQAGATVAYLSEGKWIEAVLWAAYGISNAAYLLLHRS